MNRGINHEYYSRLSTCVTEEMYNLILDESANMQITVSEWVRYAIRNTIDNKNKIKPGSVIQVNKNNPEWDGCLLTVDSVKPWGVVAWMDIPQQGTAYLRLTPDQFEYVGNDIYLSRGLQHDM